MLSKHGFRTTVPGTMNVRGASIQILDLPGIIEGAKDGKGRGRQVIAGTECNFGFISLPTFAHVDPHLSFSHNLGISCPVSLLSSKPT
jgi:GTPase involved in cell partitioning and DNA repair